MSAGDDEQQNTIKFIILQAFLKDLDQDKFVSTFSYTEFSDTQFLKCANIAFGER